MRYNTTWSVWIDEIKKIITIKESLNVKQVFFENKDIGNEKVFSLRLEGIINGKGDYTFAPDDFLAREEAATILYRVAEYMEIDMPQSAYDESIPYYADKEAISD